MNKMLTRWCIVVIALLVVTGCGTTSQYFHINVSAFQNANSIQGFTKSSMIYVIKNEKSENTFLESEINKKISTLLQQAGYQLTDDPKKADYYLVYAYGIGDRRDVTVNVPFRSGGGVAMANTYGTHGRSFTTMTIPSSVSVVPVQSAEYDRWLSTFLFNKNDTKASKENAVWVADTRSTGSSSDLRLVIDYMVIAAIDQFGKNTNAEANIRGNDTRVKNLRKSVGQDDGTSSKPKMK